MENFTFKENFNFITFLFISYFSKSFINLSLFKILSFISLFSSLLTKSSTLFWLSSTSFDWLIPFQFLDYSLFLLSKFFPSLAALLFLFYWCFLQTLSLFSWTWHKSIHKLLMRNKLTCFVVFVNYHELFIFLYILFLSDEYECDDILDYS